MNSTKGDNTPTNTKDLKELLLDHFVNSMPVEVDRDYASVLLDRVLQQAVNKAEVTMWGKTTKAMMDILQENFHYRLMCGEVRDPDGKIDVMSEFEQALTSWKDKEVQKAKLRLINTEIRKLQKNEVWYRFDDCVWELKQTRKRITKSLQSQGGK